MTPFYDPDESILSYLLRMRQLPSTDPQRPKAANMDQLWAAALQEVRMRSLANIETLRAAGLEHARLDDRPSNDVRRRS